MERTDDGARWLLQPIEVVQRRTVQAVASEALGEGRIVQISVDDGRPRRPDRGVISALIGLTKVDHCSDP